MKNRLYAMDASMLRNDELFRKWYERMPAFRKEKIDRFRFEKDKCLSLAAGILLLRGLEKAGISDPVILEGENGKPGLAPEFRTHFNLSHTKGAALCAFSDRPVGADIEYDRHFKESFIRYVYTESETEEISRSSEDPDRSYTRLWTIKESLMKYWGAGLSLEPKNIRIDLKEPVRAFAEGYDCTELRFTGYRTRGYTVTVCSEYAPFTEDVEWMIPE